MEFLTTIRQDIRLAIDILYRNSFSDEYKMYISTLGIYNFKDLFINIKYYDNVKLINSKFENVKFYGDESYYAIFFDKFNTFDSCEFKCDFKFYMNEHSSVGLNSCKLKSIELFPNTEIRYDRTKKNGTKNLKINDCIVEKFSNLSNNVFNSLIISNSKFEQRLQLKCIEVDSELTVTNTELSRGIDFESSVIQWKIDFSNTVCKESFYFIDSKFLKQERINFHEFYVEGFAVGNLGVQVYTDPHGGIYNQEYQKFGDLYKLVWVKEKNLFILKKKEENW